MVRHLFAKTASGITAAAVLFVLPQSCVNEEYSLDKELDLTVSFGGDALVFPLGSTEQLKLKTLLSEEDFKYITSSDDGAYRFTVTPENNEPIDLSDEIPDLAEELKIDPIELNESYKKTINVNLNAMQIDEIVFPEGDKGKITFDDMNIDIDSNLPNEQIVKTESVEIAKYRPDTEQLTLDFDLENNSFSFNAGNDPTALKQALALLNVGDDETIDLMEYSDIFKPSLPITGISTGVNIKIQEIELEEGISEVRNIKFAAGAAMKVKVTMDNSFFATGTATPNIRISGLNEILEMSDLDAAGILDLSKSLSMEATGASTVTGEATYKITGLRDMQWDGNRLTGQEFDIDVADGASIDFTNITTTKNLLAGVNESFGIDVEISFEKLVIDDMTLDVAAVEQKVENSEIALDIDPIQLPEEVVAVNEVTMSENSEFRLDIASTDLNISGLSAEIASLEIKFPDIIRFGTFEQSSQFGADEGFDGQTNTLTLANVDLKSGRTVSLPVASIIPGEPDSENKLNLSSTVTVNAEFSAAGDDLSLKSMPDTDPQIVFSVTPTLSVADYAVKTGRIVHEVTDIDEEVSIDLPEGIEDLGTVRVTPGTDKHLTINIIKPTFEDIRIYGDNLVVSLPEMIVLKDVDPDYNYDAGNNTLTFDGILPDNIDVLIDYIEVGPDDYDETAGKYVAKGNVTVTGNAVISTKKDDNIVHKQDIDLLVSDGIEVNGRVDGIAIAECTVSLEEYSFTMDEQTQTINLFDTSKLPDGIESLSIDEVLLSDTELSLTINSSELGLEAQPQIDIKVELPKEIVIENDERVDENNVLTVKGQFTDNEFILSPALKISSLDLSGIDFSQEGTISREMKISGKVFVDKPEIKDPESLNNKEVSVDVIGGIDRVTIDRITGKIGYVLGQDTEGGSGEDNMNEKIDLSGLPEFLKGENITLDFLNPHIKVDVTSNIGIPVKGTIHITPVFGTEPDASSAVNVDITIPKAENAQTVQTTSYWISDAETDGIPGNYTWVQAGIRKLLTKIPDAINLEIEAVTDAEQPFVVEPEAEYELKLNYEVIVPLEFGEQLDIRMDYTFPNDGEKTEGEGGDGTQPDQSGEGTSQGSDKLPAELGELLNMNSLGLTGSIESTLPLQLDMTLDLLDSNREIIPSEKISIPVKAGSADYPAVSPLDVVLKLAEGADGKDLSYIRMNFTVTSGNMSGEPVTESSYIKATLKAKVPGGVTIDLSSLGESEENTDNTDNSGNQN